MDDTELFKQFTDNERFKRWMTDTLLNMLIGNLRQVPNSIQTDGSFAAAADTERYKRISGKEC